MKATNWEFRNRALLFGLIFAFSFPLYFLDHQSSTRALASWLGPRLQRDPDLVARLLFAFAAVLLIVAALFRSWASSYLRAGVVYAAEVKTDSLVADGPYRLVRNSLYFANLSMVIAMGAMMSRPGFLVAVVAMRVFCYRSILWEEAELQASQGQQYEGYRKAVPRLWPALWPRIASAGCQARWIQGRILVLGIRGSARNLCHNSKTHSVFLDSERKPGLVLGVLSGSSKEVKLAGLTRVPVDMLSPSRTLSGNRIRVLLDIRLALETSSTRVPRLRRKSDSQERFYSHFVSPMPSSWLLLFVDS